MASIHSEFASVLDLLRFSREPDAFKRIPNGGWDGILAICDREHLTLPLYRALAGALPETIYRRMEGDLSRNEERVQRVQAAFTEIAAKFAGLGVEATVLKGFAQYPDFVPDLRHRVQYDLDFFCPEDSVHVARDALLELGYEPLRDFEQFPTDHLPVMIRETGWQWRGDFFDPDIPVAIDLHFRFWDAETEGFEAPGADLFWSRSRARQVGERNFVGLRAADALGYHCLHLLRHLLRASLRLSHVYELAWFLENRAGDDAFWQEWQSLHSDALCRLEAIGFRLAQSWFGCRLAPLAAQEIECLPAQVHRWFEQYARAPIEQLFWPNKNELWLHLELVESAAARRKVVRRRLFPARLPGPVDAVYIPEDQMSLRLRLRRKIRYAAHLAARATHHVRVLPSVGWNAVRWKLGHAGLPGNFWTFIATASLFNFGLFVFVLLYNLYLLDRGYHEDFLGIVNGAFTAGSVLGALPAGAMLQRYGIGPAFRLCIVSAALISALRALIPGAVPLVGLALLGGVAFSLWAVIIAPAIAQLTTERARPQAFSFFFGISIAVGMLGGLAGGRIPGWIAVGAPSATATWAKQAALLAGSGFVLMALWPASRLKFSGKRIVGRPEYPLGPFIRRFLLAIAGWNLAVGAFNPFFNTLFARRLGARVEQIGIVFSVGQLAQVGAMLAAPAVLKRLGLINGVMATQIAAGLALAALASLSGIWAAALAYAAYAAFQYMSEPGLYTLLMNRVRPEEQGGASSLNFLTAFSAQAIAAALAGSALSRFGYRAVISSIALVVILSALLFRTLLRNVETSSCATE